jgi:hypothetical protein
MFTLLLTAAAGLGAWGVWREAARLIQANAAPTGEQLWLLAQPAQLILLPFALALAVFKRGRKQR